MATMVKDKTTGKWATVAGGHRMWVGTKESLKKAIDNNELEDGVEVMVTDDYDDRMHLIDVESSAGTRTWDFSKFIAEMLNDIGMENWDVGTYAGMLHSTKPGEGDFGTWVGSYQMTKAFDGEYGCTIFGSANGATFSGMYVNATKKWAIKADRIEITEFTLDTNANRNSRILLPDGNAMHTAETEVLWVQTISNTTAVDASIEVAPDRSASSMWWCWSYGWVPTTVPSKIEMVDIPANVAWRRSIPVTAL